MKKIFTLFLLLACCATVVQAQMPATVQRQLPTVIEQFNHEKPFLNHAYWYVLTDVDSDGFNEFAIADFESASEPSPAATSTGNPCSTSTAPRVATPTLMSPSSIAHCSSTRFKSPRTVSQPTTLLGSLRAWTWAK